MNKFYLTLGLVAATFGSLVAGPVDQHKAQQLGAKFLGTSVIGQRTADIQLDLVATANDIRRGATDYYVFNVKDGEGFVVVAGDDRVKPILAYSTTGAYDPANVAEAFAFTLMRFQDEIQYVRNHNLEATPDIVAEWKSVAASGQIAPGRNARSVEGPFCETLWNQSYPWNSQCPEDPEGHGGYTYAGCVATALGQVMKFWDWPAQGNGSHTYTPDGYPQQTANFGETEYHFELMPLALDSTTTLDDAYYIAQLLHHIGVAVDMQYSAHGSGAYSEDVHNVLRNNFRYACDDYICNYEFIFPGMGYTNEQWLEMLKSSGLYEGMPLYYSGTDDLGRGGHAYVCDGFDENDYLHFNWGWSGVDNAWCPVGALNTTQYAFNTLNGFVGHMRPQDAEYFQRPDAVADFEVTENEQFDGVKLSWTNPANDLNGNALTGIESVTIRRNLTELAVLTNAQVGAAMDYEDSGLAPGLYQYEIYVTNAAGTSHTERSTILVGEKCDITFQLHDQGGDGWMGAAISVADENGKRFAVVTLSEGAESTVTMPLLKGNISFHWNHGWYHSSEQYNTDDECSFSILDANGNVLYTSAELEDGVFLNYNNDCDPTEVQEVVAELVQVYPNPTSGTLFVEGEGEMRISVVNVLGQKLIETTAEGNATLNLGNDGPGMYLLRIETAKGVMVQKVSVRK